MYYIQSKHNTGSDQGGVLINQGGVLINQGGVLINQGGVLINQGGVLINQGGHYDFFFFFKKKKPNIGGVHFSLRYTNDLLDVLSAGVSKQSLPRADRLGDVIEGVVTS